tara:strand:- start:377 stop:736 length:360 start_codon:yes stop_codon:yes gene_type:complete
VTRFSPLKVEEGSATLNEILEMIANEETIVSVLSKSRKGQRQNMSELKRIMVEGFSPLKVEEGSATRKLNRILLADETVSVLSKSRKGQRREREERHGRNQGRFQSSQSRGRVSDCSLL